MSDSPASMPRHPVYIISKGRHAKPLTATVLVRDRVPFSIVVEPQEREAYEAAMRALCEREALATGAPFEQYAARVRVLVLPFSNLGLGGIPARNWVLDHARASSAERHWILDDNIREVQRVLRKVRVKCDAGAAFAIVERFIDRYSNVAIAGLNYANLVPDNVTIPPVITNTRVYSCLCIDNAIPVRWRGRYNEDADLCLQVLTRGLCTVLVSAFVVEKKATLAMKGGNSDELYANFGRTRMARELQRRWPRAVQTVRRFGRAQHFVVSQWRGFTHELRLKPGVDLSALPAVDEHGLRVVATTEPKHPTMQRLLSKNDDGNRKA